MRLALSSSNIHVLLTMPPYGHLGFRVLSFFASRFREIFPFSEVPVSVQQAVLGIKAYQEKA